MRKATFIEVTSAYLIIIQQYLNEQIRESENCVYVYSVLYI